MEKNIKVVVPAAGAGKRLFPHTFTKPKPMMYVAGKPIIGHILDGMKDIEPEEIIMVVGYKKEHIMSYVDKNYSSIFNIKFVDQEEQLGLGHSIYVARDEIGDSNIMIALGDNIFKAGYSDFYQQHLKNGDCSGSIGIMEVDDPKKYGIVELEGEYIKKLVEKPSNPVSNLGVAGAYFINDTPTLMSALKDIIRKNQRMLGEYQLTEALQEMVMRGCCLKAIPVLDRFDCGRTELLLEVNHMLLDEMIDININNDYMVQNSVIIQPAAIGENVKISNSVIGPHTSIANDSCIKSSIISDCIIGSRSSISNVNLQRSILGDDVNVRGKYNSLNIGDLSSLEF